MIEENGDLFQTAASYIGHGVNVRGMMGAGIAKTFKEWFPTNYVNYREACHSSSLMAGGYVSTQERINAGTGRLYNVVNFATQVNPGPDAKYEHVFSSLWRWADRAQAPDRLAAFGGIIAVPEIGCGIGGLDWPVVKDIMKLVEKHHTGIEFEVWHYPA